MCEAGPLFLCSSAAQVPARLAPSWFWHQCRSVSRPGPGGSTLDMTPPGLRPKTIAIASPVSCFRPVGHGTEDLHEHLPYELICNDVHQMWSWARFLSHIASKLTRPNQRISCSPGHVAGGDSCLCILVLHWYASEAGGARKSLTRSAVDDRCEEAI